MDACFFAIIRYRLSVGTRGKNVFTRSQQAKLFAAAYKDLPVHTTTLRNLGNFKGLMNLSDSIHKVAGIARPHAIRLEKRGF